MYIFYMLQGVSSAEAKLLTYDIDSQQLLFHTLAAKFVRQELLIQIHMYSILDAYSKIQVHSLDKINCLVYYLFYTH